MGTLVGRDAEFARCRAVFDSSAKGGYVRAVRIVGLSGTGKTALALEAASAAREQGWLVAETPSFRIHAGLPLFAARRVMQSLLEALGPEAPRYESGLQAGRERSDAFGEAFLRLIEGVTLDYRVALLFDDAQWADGESRALIASTMTALANRPIVLLSTERSDEATSPAFSVADETIALGDLPALAASAVVRSIYPDASDEVTRAIVEATQGHAIDLVALATAARETGARSGVDLNESTGRIVARDLALLDSAQRTFLQLCALIDEPIELRLLQRLWPHDELMTLISAVSGRYLTSGADGLRFVHAAILDSVVATIPISIPLRYRIIDAIKSLPSPSIDDYERLARQAAACGDRELERESLLNLADLAATRAMSSLAIDAIERALVLRDPAAGEICPLYTRLSQLYNFSGDELGSIRASQAGLEAAAAAGISNGIGALASSLIFATFHTGRSADALEQLRYYEAAATSPEDLAHIQSAAYHIAAQRADEAELERLRSAFSNLSDAPPITAIRINIAEAYHHFRQGEENKGLEFLRTAERLCDAQPHARPMARTARLHHAFMYGGINGVEREFERLEFRVHEPAFRAIRPHTFIARGALEDARDIVTDWLPAQRDSLVRLSLYGALSTAIALQKENVDEAVWEPLLPSISPLEETVQSTFVWPTAIAYAYHLSRTAPKRAAPMVRLLAGAVRSAPALYVMLYPILLAGAAHNVGAKDVLEQLAAPDGMWNDPQPWPHAQRLLARVAALAYLDRPNAALADEASQRLSTLGAPFFSALTKDWFSPAADPQRVVSAAFGQTTRREREIASLVAEGLTNRQIAERLVLSERTVEGHVASLFAKVNVNSRTQLAAWYIRMAIPA